MNIPQRLKEIRTEKGYSQQDIADLFQTTQMQISKYENGVQEIPLRRIIQLADLYKCSIDYLIGREF